MRCGWLASRSQGSSSWASLAPGFHVCHHTWLFTVLCWKLNWEMAVAWVPTLYQLGYLPSPEKTAFHLTNPETLIIFDFFPLVLGFDSGSHVCKVRHSINVTFSFLCVIFGTMHRLFQLANICISRCLRLFSFLESYMWATKRSARILHHGAALNPWEMGASR